VLESARQLQSNPKVHFLLVGDGKEKLRLVQKASVLDLSNVTFLDPIPKNQMPELYAASNACLAILKPVEMYKTTYPNKVFDYMAARKPVLCMIDGEIRKVVENAKCGVFVKPGDATELVNVIIHLIQSPSDCQIMGAAGQDYLAKHFNRSDVSQKLLKMF